MRYVHLEIRETIVSLIKTQFLPKSEICRVEIETDSS